MKNGVLTQGRKRIMLGKGCKNFHFRKGLHRTGLSKRKLVRGCIISPEIRVLHLKIVKAGDTPIPGLNEPGSELPKRVGPKKATRILKEYGLLEIYNKKKASPEDRKTLRFMITKFAGKRTVNTKNGKEFVKRPKIQRLITPTRLRRKKVIKKLKEERRNIAEENLKNYRADLHRIEKQLKKEKLARKSQKAKKKSL